jgi:hypothetical protein
MFPHIVLQLGDSVIRHPAEVDVHVDMFRDQAQKMVGLAGSLGRPIMLKSLRYPWRGATGASPLLQERYFAGVLRTLDDRLAGLDRTPFAVQSAFDSVWKKLRPSESWERFTGLITDDGIARPAAKEVVSHAVDTE